MRTSHSLNNFRYLEHSEKLIYIKVDRNSHLQKNNIFFLSCKQYFKYILKLKCWVSNQIRKISCNNLSMGYSNGEEHEPPFSSSGIAVDLLNILYSHIYMLLIGRAFLPWAL